MDTLAERITSAMREAGVREADLVRACNVKAPSVTAWCNGDTKTLKGRNLVKAAARLGVNPLWLSSGEGPRQVGYSGASPKLTLVAQATPNDWPFRHVTPLHWSALPLPERQRIEAFALATLQAWESNRPPPFSKGPP